MDGLKDLLNQVKDAAGPVVADLLKWVLLAVLVVAVFYVAWRILRRPKGRLPRHAPDLAIDVTALPAAAPPADAPKLYYYNVPVRLAVLVLAPAGRVRELPPLGQLDGIMEAIVPGLSQVVAAHRTVVRRWPGQLSVNGFVHQFFANAKLPGQGGKGTPWSSAAGMLKIEGQTLIAGLVLRAEAPTNLGQMIVEREAQWLDILRIK